LRVGVLEDDDDFATLLVELLRDEGYRPERPALPASADGLVELLAAGRYDLVILDLHGVAGNDLSVVERARSDPRLAQLPILVCSADIQVLRDTAPRLSVLPYTAALEKPFRIEMLSGALRRLRDGSPATEPLSAPPDRATLAELQTWLERLGGLIRWPVLDAWIPDVRPGFLRCAAAWAAAERFEPFAALSRRTHLPLGGGLPGRVWVSGRATWIDDVSRDLNFPRQPAARAVGLVSAAASPVVDLGRTVGVVAAYHTMRRAQDASVVHELAAASSEALGLFRSIAASNPT
jgi:CheY-like chemotaxis protein